MLHFQTKEIIYQALANETINTQRQTTKEQWQQDNDTDNEKIKLKQQTSWNDKTTCMNLQRPNKFTERQLIRHRMTNTITANTAEVKVTKI